MNTKNVILLLLVCLSILFSTALKAERELIVRMSENAFPVGFKTASVWQGMDVDVLDAMFAGTDLQYKLVTMPFKRAIAEMAKGEVDIVANLTMNAQRSKDMYWIGPVRSTQVALLVLKKNQGPIINNFAELIDILETNHQQIGHVIGVSYSPLLDDKIENNQRLRTQIWKSAARWQIVEMLQKDRIFGFFQDEFEASSLIAASKDDLTKPYADFVIRNSKLDNSRSGAYFGVSKQLEQDTLNKLNQAFLRIQQDGTLQKLYEKWLRHAAPRD